MPTQPIYAMLDTWSSGVTTYKGISMNVTDAASASDSKLIDMLISSVSKFSVDKLGNIIAVGGLDIALNAAIGGNATIGGDAAIDGNLTVAGTGRVEGILSADALELDNDLPVAHGGTGASTPSAARSNLEVQRDVQLVNGLEIGSGLTGDRTTYVDLHASGLPGALDFSARLIRSLGVNGVLELLQTGTGNIDVVGGGDFTRGGNRIWHAGNDGAGSTLDADLLDGQQGAYYLPAASYTAADVKAKLLTVDGDGSGVDADLLDGYHASNFATEANSVGRYNDIINNRLPGKANLTGANFSGDLEITKADATLWLHSPGVKRAGLRMGASDGRLYYFDQGGTVHFWIGGAGQIWTQELGDLNSRIENRAAAWANDRVAALATRKTSHVFQSTLSDGDWATPGGTFMYGYRRGGRVDGFFYAYFQLYDPVYGWRTMSG